MRKEQLSEVIELEDQELKRLWEQLTEEEKEMSRGEQIARFIKYGIMAYDGFMTFHKLKRNYGNILKKQYRHVTFWKTCLYCKLQTVVRQFNTLR